MIKSIFDDQDKTENPESMPGAIDAAGSNNAAEGPEENPEENTASVSETAEIPEPRLFATANQPPESIAETARKSGLAWSAGIVMFGSIAFMMVIGWGADLLFGSSPWGIVVGIVLGAVIGFFQLFRLTSQIFRK